MSPLIQFLAVSAIGGGWAAWWFVNKFDASVLFTWHVLLAISAFALIGPLAVVLARCRHSAKGTCRMLIMAMHSVLHLTAVACAAGSWYFIWTNKDNAGKDHLTSYHSWSACAASAIFCMAYLGGALTTVGRLFSGKKGSIFGWRDGNHVLAGKLAYTLALGVTMSLGIWKVKGKAIEDENVAYAMIGSVIALALVMAGGSPAEAAGDKQHGD